MNEDMLDSLQSNPLDIEIPEPTDIQLVPDKEKVTRQIIQDDLILANAQLKAVHAGWGYVDNISKLSRMVDATIKAVIHRRAVLGIPYGYQPQNSKGTILEPLE